MNVTITPKPLEGTITPPPSKSQAHRALLAAALSGGVSLLSGLAQSQDIAATLSCLRALGTGVEEAGPGALRIHGLGCSIPQAGPFPVFDCGESGSTLRFLIPVALVAAGGGWFTGRGRLLERPQGPYFALFEEKGVSYERTGDFLTVQGRLTPGTYALPGDVSSQFVTGLLYALPLLEGDSELVLTTPLESRGYVDMTLDVLRKFGIRVEETASGFRVPGNQAFQARDLTIEADWSQAAFWYAANFLDGAIDIQGLDHDSAQGDRRIALDYWTLARPGEVELDVSQCPDLVPPLAAIAAGRSGVTRLTHAARLRMKESDRLTAVADVLTALGAEVAEGPDSLTLTGRDTLPGGAVVDSHNDHRIAMMAAVAALACEAPVTVTGAECVAKSYPNFWEDYEKLGGELTRSGG
ncbi:3-phosphoshikimate 1-carboxyvinyltransferase [uncultured Intestinimonas sp.]|uniref:3-phosphoshikimate 1-carboxyvinyltransferase n=1 Tax=uncultured Intestinimonas sp. TaxID=1689265 RepID=UPI0025DBD702|nr:3-phosphoshikimate 1-carboxyvinyltransferase [uncultured Intestinimonas sp.]